MNSVQIEITKSSREVTAVITGDFTEHSDFSLVVSSAAPTAPVVFDLRGVRRINSCGVREWIRLVDALRAANVSFVFEHCSVPFVNQMNMIVNFTGGARVRSFYAPYLCASCNEEHTRLCEITEHEPPRLEGTSPCPRCGAAAEFDDLAEFYLSFVSSSR